MFDLKPEHSVDLEWLLQSGEASQETIIAYLLRETYFPVYQLTYALLGSADAAQKAALELLAEAMLHPRSYRGDVTVLEWLDQLAVKVLHLRENHQSPESPFYFRDEFLEMALPLIPNTGDDGWGAVQRLAAPVRIPLALMTVRGLSTSEIARMLRVGIEEVERRLEMARRALASAWGMGLGFDAAEVDRQLDAFFWASWEKTAPSSPDWEDLNQQVQRLIHEKSARQRWTQMAKQALVVGITLSLIVLLIRFQGGRSSSSRIPAVLRTVRSTISPTASPTPAPATRPVQTAVPLDGSASGDQIRQRIIDSRDGWHTLWADAEIIYYGSANYIGPSQVYRNQIYIHQPERALELAGFAEQNPQYLRVVDQDYALEADLLHGLTFEKDLMALSLKRLSFPYLYSPWEEISSERPSPYGFYLYELLYPTDTWWPSGRLTVIETETISDRTALVVKWQSDHHAASAQMWVDAQTGIILRLWLFNHDNPDLVDMEIRLTDFVLDARFPHDLFTLSNYWFDDLTWQSLWKPAARADLLPDPLYAPAPGRDAYTLIPPPLKVNWFMGQLTFQWTEDQENPAEPGDVVDLILDGYWIGRVGMSDPWSISCERSPNGRYIAYAQGYLSDFFSSDGLGWIDLHAANSTNPLFIEGRPGGDFAFSPDSRWIAYAGCLDDRSSCAVYLHDFQDLTDLKLATVEDAGAFAWSPDGKQLALVGKDPQVAGRKWELMVIQVETGEVVYRSAVDPRLTALPEDVPVRTWGIQYPPVQAGLEGCAFADTQKIMDARQDVR